MSMEGGGRKQSRSKSRGGHSSATKTTVSRKKEEEALLAKRKFKNYVIAKKSELAAASSSQKEIPFRFYEIVMKQVENNGAQLILNLDTLRETKSDAKVGALILQHMDCIETIVLHSEFCGVKEMPNLYKRLY